MIGKIGNFKIKNYIMENFIIAILVSIGVFLFLNRRRSVIKPFKWYLRGPSKDMSKSKIILGCIN